MGPKQQKKSTSTEEVEEREALAIRIIDLLTDQQVLSALKKALFPTELVGKIEELNNVIGRLSTKLSEKEDRVVVLDNEVRVLADANDTLEQYTRRANLIIDGIPESHDGEDTDEKVLAIVNDKLGMNPPLQRHDLERSHRLGRRDDRQGRPRKRAVIVRFRSERLRDEVYRVRTKLKVHNQEQRDAPLYINDDLTARRAKLAFDCRLLKKERKIADCWTAYGKVLIKDLNNKVEIKTSLELHNL